VSATAIDPATRVGPVRLRVADLPRVRGFYERVLGLQARGAGEDGAVVLGAPGGAPLVELAGRPDAAPRPPGASGLFHVALLYPERADLARALRRVVESGHPLSGASDHLVSEALYLSDPEGNGIELYRDRPRAEWTHDPGGELRMATLPLDLHDLAAAAADASGEEPPPAATTVGHVHLQVAELEAAEAFYAGLLGFEVMVRGYPGALFVAAGGYHHHLGLNTWASRGGPPNAPGTRGLERFEVTLPGTAALAPLATRLADAGLATREHPRGLLIGDPFGNELLLASDANAPA
jgi:catechol 2,3-dioxygenase